jgi:hypothetical protein
MCGTIMRNDNFQQPLLLTSEDTTLTEQQGSR